MDTTLLGVQSEEELKELLSKAEGCSDKTSAVEKEYTEAIATLKEVNLQYLVPFFIYQRLTDTTLLGVQSEEELKELLSKTLQPFTSLWFQKYPGNIGNPRPFGADVGDLFYESGSKLKAIEDREVEFKSFKAPPHIVGPQNSQLTWPMMEKAKDFICGCLNAERNGVIYFGVGDQGEVLGLEIEDMKDEIVTAFQDVLNDHIRSDGGSSLSTGEQDCIKRHFIPVKQEGNPTKSYVIEIEVARDWKFCKDNVYYSKTWKKKDKKKDNNNKVTNLKALRNFFEPGEWDDAHVRTDGRTSSFKKEEVYQKVKKPLQVKFEEWKAKQDPNSLKTDSQIIAERRKQVVTEQQLSNISIEVGTCWKELAPELGIPAVKCGNIDEEQTKNREKAYQLLLEWKGSEASNATVGRLADALLKIKKKEFAEKLLAL